jgi:hypothetical protein
MSFGPPLPSTGLNMGYDVQADPLGSRYSVGYGTEAVESSAQLGSDIYLPPDNYPGYVFKQDDRAAWMAEDYFPFPA